MSERLPEKFIAIPRHAFYSGKSSAPDLPIILSDYFNPQAPMHTRSDAPAISLPIEYIIMPAAGGTGWNGVNPLNRLFDTVDNKSGKSPLHRKFSTLTLSQSIDRKRDDVSIAQLGYQAYQEVKKIGGDKIIEVESLEDLVKARGASGQAHAS